MLPQEFIRNMQTLLGDAAAATLCQNLCNAPNCTSLRYNPAKNSPSLHAELQLTTDAISDADKHTHQPLLVGRPVAWCKQGYYLRERPSFTFDPRLHAGAYYVQEAASMFIAQVYQRIAQDFTPQRILDLCAAPGGKSTLWRSMMPEATLLVANEYVRQRAHILAENLCKWGQPDCVCTHASAEDLGKLTGFFDVVATDVPCSGEGMFRKDLGAREAWSETAVTACVQRQKEILTHIWPALRTGGYLVYSTCTFNTAENEEMTDFICQELGAEYTAIPTAESWHIQGELTPPAQRFVYRFFPHLTEGEGLFVALLRKTTNTPTDSHSPKKKKRDKKNKEKLPQNVLQSLTTYLNQQDFEILPQDDSYIALRKSLKDDMLRVAETVNCISMGTNLACKKGNKMIPQHALALSTLLNRNAFPNVDIDYDTAIAYLRRESISLAPTVPRGYVLLCYDQLPLGFVNNLGTRANNLYPENWRIRLSR